MLGPFLLFAALGFASAGGSSVPATQAAERVWFLSQTCRQAETILQVRFHGSLVFETALSLCHADRTTMAWDSRIIEFSFAPKRAIVWRGYRTENNKTTAAQVLEGNLWASGAEEDLLLLGVSFSDRENIYMKTHHFLYPLKRSETKVADGLVVVSFPKVGK